MAEQNSMQKRQVAYKVKISDLVNGRYVKAEGEWEPNYIMTPFGLRVSRANIMGAVVSDAQQDQGSHSLTIDDGEAKMPVRVFDDSALINTLTMGDIAMIIGRPREYSGQVYMVPEIVKKISDSRWIAYRRAELPYIKELFKKHGILEKPLEETKTGLPTQAVVHEEMIAIASPAHKEMQKVQAISQPIKNASPDRQLSGSGTAFEPANPQDDVKGAFDMLLEIIQEYDDGQGAEFEEVVMAAQKNGVENAEKFLTNMLEEGEIFELRPGRLKVL